MRCLTDIVLKKDSLMLPGSASVKEACQQMLETRMDSVLVVDEENGLLGIFTNRDVINRVIASGRDAESTLLSHVMTSHPTTLPTNNNAIEAMRLMWDGGFRHIPVLENGQVAGVVSRSDFKSDEEIQLERERELWEHMR